MCVCVCTCVTLEGTDRATCMVYATEDEEGTGIEEERRRHHVLTFGILE